MGSNRINADHHCGWTGRTNHNNVYRVKVSRGQGPFSLRCYYWTPVDSYGKIVIKKLPDGDPKEIAAWEERSTENRVWPTNNVGGNPGLNGTIRSQIAGAQIEGIDYDVTRFLDGHGRYEVDFKYRTPNLQGNPVLNGTYIKGVELYRGGRRTFVEWAQDSAIIICLFVAGAIASILGLFWTSNHR